MTHAIHPTCHLALECDGSAINTHSSSSILLRYK
jgi:hypothetical protein